MDQRNWQQSLIQPIFKDGKKDDHLLTPELAWEVFVSQGVGALRYSAAVVGWDDTEMAELQRLWVQGYQAAWHLNPQAALVLLLCRQRVGD